MIASAMALKICSPPSARISMLYATLVAWPSVACSGSVTIEASDAASTSTPGSTSEEASTCFAPSPSKGAEPVYSFGAQARWAGVLTRNARLFVAAPEQHAIISTLPDGSDVRVLSPIDVSFEFAADGASIYWQHKVSSAGLYGVPLSGGPAKLLYPLAASDYIWGMAISGINLYFNLQPDNTLKTLPVTGGQAIDVGAAHPGHVAIDDQYVYSAGAAQIWRTPVKGGSPSRLYSEKQPSSSIIGGIAIDTDYIYFSIGSERVCCGNAPWCPCRDGVCCKAVEGGGRIIRIMKDGSAPVVLASCLRQPTSIAASNDILYIIDAVGFDTDGSLNATGGRVIAIPKRGGRAVTLVDGQQLGWPPEPQSLARPSDIAADDGFVYFATPRGVERVPRR
jgi:hypothetical protein